MSDDGDRLVVVPGADRRERSEGSAFEDAVAVAAGELDLGGRRHPAAEDARVLPLDLLVGHTFEVAEVEDAVAAAAGGRAGLGVANEDEPCGTHQSVRAQVARTSRAVSVSSVAAPSVSPVTPPNQRRRPSPYPSTIEAAPAASTSPVRPVTRRVSASASAAAASALSGAVRVIEEPVPSPLRAYGSRTARMTGAARESAPAAVAATTTWCLVARAASAAALMRRLSVSAVAP